jgi:flagellar biosynthesis protein FliR
MADFDTLLKTMGVIQEMSNGQLDAGILMLSRFSGFMSQAPILSRKDVPSQFKVPLAMLLTVAMMSNPIAQQSAMILKQGTVPQVLLLVLLNVSFGFFLGYLMRMIFEAISMAGGFITSQIGLQMASMMDPTTRQSSAILGPLFGNLAGIVFLYIGGFELLLKTFDKSLQLVPLHAMNANWFDAFSIYLIIETFARMFSLAILLSAPFFISTILMDIILGIVNKSAQQIPVFQLSASLKPLLGLIIFFVTVPGLFPIMKHIFIKMLIHL